MNPTREILEAFRSGELELEEAMQRLSRQATQDLDFARIDHDRARRRGTPEVIFGEGKSPAQIRAIFQSLAQRNANVLSTRTSPEAAAEVKKDWPEAKYYPISRVLRLFRSPKPLVSGKVLVVSAGTSDQFVAEEAQLSSEFFGNPTELLQDVGVAGIHRLFEARDKLESARVLIVVAGMEGALASVVAGLVSQPVLAVPTSVGYGASFHGLAALLGMLSSCASGVSVVNIDNGFGAARAATAINRLGQTPS